jgi:hypothetical protein
MSIYQKYGFELQVCDRPLVKIGKKIILWYPSSEYIIDPMIVLKDSTSRYDFSCEQISLLFKNSQRK